jgi:hypothetical protein
MISHTLAITDFLKNPKKVQEDVKRGMSFTVFSRSEPVFTIHPVVKKKKPTKITLPSQAIGLPKKITRQDIYEKYETR